MANSFVESRRYVGILFTVLALPLLSASPLNFSSPYATIAIVIVFGVPDAVVESTIGLRARVADIVSIDMGDGYVSGGKFLESLKGSEVKSGNSYTVEPGDDFYNASDPTRRDDVLIEGGVQFPLKVIDTHQDLQLVFVRDGRAFRTVLGRTEYGQFLTYSEDRVTAVPRFGFIGRYALSNGVMVGDGDGGWVTSPIDQNARLRIHDREFDVSIVIVYSFPFD